MVDIVDKETRSRMMASIRSKDTKPELVVRRGLHRLGMRFRLHCSNLPGKPDLVFPKHHVALFVHGCFWHRHAGCRFAYAPFQNAEQWVEKFLANIERDRHQVELLQQKGWRVFVIWECALRVTDVSPLLSSVATELLSNNANYQEWPRGATAG